MCQAAPRHVSSRRARFVPPQASHVIYRYTRVRLIAFLLVAADTSDWKDHYRGVRDGGGGGCASCVDQATTHGGASGAVPVPRT